MPGYNINNICKYQLRESHNPILIMTMRTELIGKHLAQHTKKNIQCFTESHPKVLRIFWIMVSFPSSFFISFVFKTFAKKEDLFALSTKSRHGLQQWSWECSGKKSTNCECNNDMANQTKIKKTCTTKYHDETSFVHLLTSRYKV